MKGSVLRGSLKVFQVATLVGGLSLSTFAADYDGDGKSDLSVFRPRDTALSAEGVWSNIMSQGNYTLQFQWGNRKDFPVPGNYTSTIGADMTVFRPSNRAWYIRQYDNALAYATASAFTWGNKGDKPYPCDFNGDGLNELAIFRPSNTGKSGRFYLRNSTTDSSTTYQTASTISWGKKGDVPIPFDYDSDGKCDFAVFRTGSWLISLSSTNNTAAANIAWGAKGDVPVPGSYTADSLPDFAVFRNRTTARGGPIWIVRKSDDAGLTSVTYKWGRSGDIAVPADYDGDGKTDLAVFRKSTGAILIRFSSTDYATSTTFTVGRNGDIPLGDRRGFDPAS